MAGLDDLAQGQEIVAGDHVLDLGLDVGERADQRCEDRHDGIDAAERPYREGMEGDVFCEVLAGKLGIAPS